MADFNVSGVNHLGFVVRDLDATLAKWEALFGVKADIKVNPELDVRLGAFNLGNLRLVFNESTKAGSRWEKYLEENGEGLEHMAFDIDDIDKATEATAKAGMSLRFKDHKPMHGSITNFVEGMNPFDVEFMAPEEK